MKKGWIYSPDIIKNGLMIFGAVLAVAALSGCASSVFRSYPSQVKPVISDLKAGKELKADLFESGVKGRDKTLYLIERGRSRQLSGDLDGSKKDFEAAIAAISEQDEKANITVSGAANRVGGTILNDNAIPYTAEGYERVLLRYFQTINYLAKGDLEGGRVEIANTDHEQKLVAEQHEREIEKANEKAAKDRESAGFSETFTSMTSEVSKQFAGLDEVAGSVKNSFQNGAAYYLSGVVYESLGDINNAYISYKRALELVPDNTVVQRDTIRLAYTDSRQDELRDFKAKFGMSDEQVADLVEPKDAGRLVVVYEAGFVAQKEEIKIPVPMIGGAGISMIAFPIYRVNWRVAGPLQVSSQAGQGGTEQICNVNVLAVKNLKEQIPSMIVSQTIRFVAKSVATKAARDSAGGYGALGASLVSMATENADLRSWLTLPQSIQIYRTVLPAGRQSIALSAGGASRAVEVSVEAGKTTFLRVTKPGETLTCVHSNL